MGEIQRLTDPQSGKNGPGTPEARLSSAQVLSAQVLMAPSVPWACRFAAVGLASQPVPQKMR